MRARQYDPRIGRFTQSDPIRTNRPFSHYSYAGINPISMIDPLGLQQGPYLPPEAAKAMGEAYSQIPESAKVRIGGAVRLAAGVGGMTAAFLAASPVAFIVEWDDATAATHEMITGRPHDAGLFTLGKKMTAVVTDNPTIQEIGGSALQLGLATGSTIRASRKAASTTEQLVEHWKKPFGEADSAQYAKLKDSLAGQEMYSQFVEGSGRPIAGVGTKVPIDDIERLVATYGGSPEDWAKMSSSGRTLSTGRKVEVHWYENPKTGLRVEAKSKTQGWARADDLAPKTPDVLPSPSELRER